jgi:hypothetical protein
VEWSRSVPCLVNWNGAALFFVSLQSELEQNGFILCLVEESSEVENNHILMS